VEDLRIDVFRSVGGTNSAGTTSAVTITHIPTGVTVTANDSDDSRTNREHAMQELRRLLST